MIHQELETLSAFIDGELVDLNELERALRQPEAALLLVDFAKLRAQAHALAPDPDRAVVHRLGASSRRLRRRLAASALVAAALVAALWVPGWWKFGSSAAVEEPSQHTETLPIPSRVLRFEIGRNWH